MKPNEIFKKASSLTLETPSLFLVERDFNFQELPILKGSLVYYDGNSINVNGIIPYKLFDEKQNPKLISTDNLDSILKGNKFIFENVSDCILEENELFTVGGGIWHGDHFDKWNLDFKPFSHRIQNEQNLFYRGIEFSAVMYVYNVQNAQLTHYLSPKPSTISNDNYSIELPGNVEIGFDNSGGVNIISLNDEITINDLTLLRTISINNNGELIGMLCSETNVKFLNYESKGVIVLRRGVQIKMNSNGDVFTLDPFETENRKSYQPIEIL